MAQYSRWPSVSGGSGGVTSLNALTGALSVVAGSGISVTPAGSTITIAATGAGSGTVTSVGLSAPSSILSVSGSPVTSSGTLALALATQAANAVWAGPTTGSAATPAFRALTASDTNIPSAKTLYVDKNRTDTYTADGSFPKPFLTIQAAINQVITNADNSSFIYRIDIIGSGVYAENVTLSNAALVNLVFEGHDTATIGPVSGSSLDSATANTNLTQVIFRGVTFTRLVSLVGEITGTGFLASGAEFINCQFNSSTTVTNAGLCFLYESAAIAGTIAITNVTQFSIRGGNGFSGSTLTIVTNAGGNKPSGFGSTAVVLDGTLDTSNITLDSGSTLVARDGVRIGAPAGTFSSAGTLQCYDVTIRSNLSVTAGTTTLNNTTVVGTASISSGATIVLNGSFLTSTVTNSGTLTVNNKSTQISYTPGTSANWNSVPTLDSGALDTLATSGVVRTQTANTVLCGPTSGGAVVPAFRALVSSDIPSLSATYLPLAGGTMTGPIVIPNGLVGSPSITSSNTATGVWFPSANVLAYSSNSTEIFRTNTLGLTVGATTTQTAGLYVKQSTTTNTGILLANSNTSDVWSFDANAGGNGQLNMLHVGANQWGVITANSLIAFMPAASGVTRQYPFQVGYGSGAGTLFNSLSQLAPNSGSINAPVIHVSTSNTSSGSMAGYSTSGSSTNPMSFAGSVHTTQTSGSEVSSYIIATQKAGTLTEAARFDNNGNFTTPGAQNTGVPQTTLTGSAGTAVCSQPSQGSSYKKVVVYLNGYTDTGTQTYTFPTAFTQTPYVYGLAGGVSGATATTTTIKFTTTLLSGFVFVEGY